MGILDTFLIVLAILLGLVGLVALGFLLWPRPYRTHPAPSHPGEPAPMRRDLPEPVRRHFEETIGERPQVIHSAVAWGRGKSCYRGVWLPLRFKTWYRPGEDFYRRLELTWYMRPVLRGKDFYLRGQGGLMMGGSEEGGEDFDRSQALSLWADSIWMPSVLVHDPRIRWEAVDAHTARMVVPVGAGEDSLMLHFDPLTGRMTHLSAERYSLETSGPEPWRMDLMTWKPFHGMLLPYQVAIAWGETGSPQSYWTLDGVAYNVNVADQLG